jgi:hypothetical protein
MGTDPRKGGGRGNEFKFLVLKLHHLGDRGVDGDNININVEEIRNKDAGWIHLDYDSTVGGNVARVRRYFYTCSLDYAK